MKIKEKQDRHEELSNQLQEIGISFHDQKVAAIAEFMPFTEKSKSTDNGYKLTGEFSEWKLFISTNQWEITREFGASITVWLENKNRFWFSNEGETTDVQWELSLPNRADLDMLEAISKFYPVFKDGINQLVDRLNELTQLQFESEKPLWTEQRIITTELKEHADGEFETKRGSLIDKVRNMTEAEIHEKFTHLSSINESRPMWKSKEQLASLKSVTNKNAIFNTSGGVTTRIPVSSFDRVLKSLM